MTSLMESGFAQATDQSKRQELQGIEFVSAQDVQAMYAEARTIAEKEAIEMEARMNEVSVGWSPTEGWIQHRAIVRLIERLKDGKQPRGEQPALMASFNQDGIAELQKFVLLLEQPGIQDHVQRATEDLLALIRLAQRFIEFRQGKWMEDAEAVKQGTVSERQRQRLFAYAACIPTIEAHMRKLYPDLFSQPTRFIDRP